VRWRELNAIGKVIAALVGLVALGSAAAGSWFALDAHWVKRTEFVAFEGQVAQANQELGQTLRDIRLEVREQALVNRRATLRAEQAVLQAAAAKVGLTTYERDRLAAVTLELGDVERELERIRAKRQPGG